MLQVICVISMFLDHLGILFSVPVLRIIGRIAMPIYAYFLSISAVKTHDLDKFSFRLACMAFISQIPYFIFIGEKRANIIVTWYICVSIIRCHKTEWKKSLKIAYYILLICLLFGGLKYDYGFLAVLWFFFFYILIQKENNKAYIILVFIAVLYVLFGWYTDLFAFLAVPVILTMRKYNLERIKNVTFQKIYKVFYPAHLAFLSIFKILLGSSVL